MVRPPPESRKERFVNEILRIAEDDIHGYSQKPPSGRWGPDYDCSSLIYQAANNVGYSVDTGEDKVRFTGTMLKDFEKAGFKAIPAANVEFGDLQIGDILLNLALHAEVYVGDGESVGANFSETGELKGESGDQTTHEIDKHPVVTFDKGWDYILRPPDETDDDDEESDKMAMNTGLGPYNNYIGPGTNPYPMNGVNYPYNYTQSPNQATSNAVRGNTNWQYNQPQNWIIPDDIIYVMGIEGAKNLRWKPNSRGAFFDEDDAIMYVVSFDQNGCANNIECYDFCKRPVDIPQHLSPLMQNNMNHSQPMNNFLTKEEAEQMMKEMLENAQSPKAVQTDGNTSRNGRQSNRNNN